MFLKKNILLFSVFIYVGQLFAQTPKSLTASEIFLQIKKLNVVGSVLYIAAHPDDENTRLLGYLANEKKYRTGSIDKPRVFSRRFLRTKKNCEGLEHLFNTTP